MAPLTAQMMAGIADSPAAPAPRPQTLTASKAATLFDEFQKIVAAKPYIEAELASLKAEIDTHEKTINEHLAALGYDEKVHGDVGAFLDSYVLQVETWLKSFEPYLDEFKKASL